jgi:hypothetical protein
VQGNKTIFSFSSFSKFFFFLFQIGIRAGVVCFSFRAFVAQIDGLTFSSDWLPQKTHFWDFSGKLEVFRVSLWHHSHRHTYANQNFLFLIGVVA